MRKISSAEYQTGALREKSLQQNRDSEWGKSNSGGFQFTRLIENGPIGKSVLPSPSRENPIREAYRQSPPSEENPISGRTNSE